MPRVPKSLRIRSRTRKRPHCRNPFHNLFQRAFVIEDPTTGEKVKNLALGKQTVDMLRMLQEKTRGNLTEEEDRLLKGVLYDLKIAYVRQKG